MAPSIAILGAAVVLILLTFPVQILAPGDHEVTSCGNAFAMDLDQWRIPGMDDHYLERAYRVCMAERVDRIARAVGVAVVTALMVSVVALLTRRRDPGNPGFKTTPI